MWPVAVFLMIVVAFYWIMFCVTIAAWLKALVHLLKGNFIRCALWLNVGGWMLFWWYDRPRSWDDFMPTAAFLVGVGVLAAFMRYRRQQQRAVQAVTPFEPTGAQYQYQTRHQPARGPPCGAR